MQMEQAMLKNPLTLAATVAKVGVISALLAGAAFAQTTTVTETTVPADAVPLSAQGLSDVQVKDFLTAKGLTDINVSRADGKIKATGSKEGKSIELIYNEADGKLITVDGNSGEGGAYVDFMNLGAPSGN